MRGRDWYLSWTPVYGQAINSPTVPQQVGAHGHAACFDATGAAGRSRPGSLKNGGLLVTPLDAHPDLRPLTTADVPAFLFAADGRLVWSNMAAALFWGASSRAALEAIPWQEHAIARQVEVLAKTTGPQARRLARLNLVPRGRTALFMAQISRFDADEAGTALLVVGTEPMPRGRAAAMNEAGAPQPAPEPTPAAEAQSPVAPVSSEPALPTAAPPGAIISARAAAIAARGGQPLRFVWHADRDGRLSYVSPDFVAAVGAAAMPREDERLSDFADRVQLDEGALASAIRSHSTWSAVRVAWPIEDTETARADVELSAMPAAGFSGFAGYRGFGILNGLVARAIPEQNRPAAPSEASDLAPAAGDDEPANDLPVASGVEPATAPPPEEPAAEDVPAPPQAEAPAGTAGDGDTPSPPAASEARGNGAKVLAFPSTATLPTERRLGPTEEAALRTIARVLGGPIGLPTPPAAPTLEHLEHTAPAPQVVREPEAPPTRPEASAPTTAQPPAEAVTPSAFFTPAPAATATQPADAPTAEEVSELSAALAAARARMAELSSILDTATDGVVVLTDAGRIVSLNRSAEALFGLDGESVIDEPLTRILAPESHRSAMDYLDGLSQNGVASVLNDGREVIGIERRGGRIPLFMTIGRVSRPGERERFCAVLRDMTAWKKAESELTEAKRQAERASEQKSDFLAKISHEIRTPLNAIIGFSEVMLDARFGKVENERYRGYIADIRASGEHLLSLVNDLLDLSKIEAGKLELSFTAVKLADVVRQTVATMQQQANSEGVILRTSLPQVPLVVADARSLRQILFNLVSNAIKFTREGGQVIVSTAMTDRGEVELRVRDTGLGMNQAEITLAMEPFRQLATKSRGDGNGTGLGLPLTKSLAEANRASFAIESRSGEGTLVTITFPSTRVLAE